MRRVVVSVVVLALSSSALVRPCAAAQPVAEPAAAPPEQAPDPIAEAAGLYDEGIGYYEAAAYGHALLLWNRAYASLPSTPATQPLRAPLVLNILAAHERAYALDRNPEHLAECIRLVGNRKAELTTLYAQDPDALAELARLDARWDALARAHAEALARGELAQPLPPGVGLRYASEPEGPAQPVPPPPASPSVDPVPVMDARALAAVVAADPEFGPRYAEGKTLTGAGVGLLAAGAGLVGTGAVLLAIGVTVDGRPLTVGGGVVAGAGLFALIGGGAAWMVGGKAKREAEAGYLARERGLAAAPVWLPGGGGVGFSGRF